MLYLDYLSYNNAWKNISVIEKLLFSGIGLLIALWLPTARALAAVLLLMHLAMLAARIPPGYVARLWLGPLAFLAVGLMSVIISMNTEFFPSLYSLQLGPVYLGVTESGLKAAELLALRSAAAVSCLFMLATTTPVMHILALTARFGLLRSIIEITLLTYRFIFVILSAAGRIYTAQQSRLGYSNHRKTLSSLAALAANLGRIAFLTARDLNTALLARNYQDRLVLRCPRQRVNIARIVLIIVLWAGVVRFSGM